MECDRLCLAPDNVLPPAAKATKLVIDSEAAMGFLKEFKDVEVYHGKAASVLFSNVSISLCTLLGSLVLCCVAQCTASCCRGHCAGLATTALTMPQLH